MRKICIDLGLVHEYDRIQRNNKHCLPSNREPLAPKFPDFLQKGASREAAEESNPGASPRFSLQLAVRRAATHASPLPVRVGSPRGAAGKLVSPRRSWSTLSATLLVDLTLPLCATIAAACGAHVLRACHAVAGYWC